MENPLKLLDSPGAISSEIWGARTENVVRYVVIPEPPTPYTTPEPEEDLGFGEGAFGGDFFGDA